MSTLNDANKAFELPASLKQRCRRAYGWEEEFTNKALEGYRQFIKLKLQQEDWHATILSPSLTVDFVWHQHILDVGRYVKACNDYAGHLIDHNPNGGLDGVARAERIKSTKLCLKTLFGRNVDQEVWMFGEEDDSNSDNNTPKRRRVSNGSPPDFLGAKTLQQSLTEPIILRVRDQVGEETFFKIMKGTKMQMIFDTYAQRKGVQRSALRFLLDGERIEPTQTPITLGLGDQDEIFAMLEQAAC